MISRASSAVVAIAMAGCFVTSTESGGLGTGPEIEQHQWFAGWGSLRLGEPAGAECGGGLARVESGVGFGDVMIDGALALLTSIAGSFVCPLPAQPTPGDATLYASCMSLFAGLGPVLLARKTVSYRCTR